MSVEFSNHIQMEQEQKKEKVMLNADAAYMAIKVFINSNFHEIQMRLPNVIKFRCKILRKIRYLWAS